MIQERVPNRSVAVIDQPINVWAALLQRMDILICNNSGPMHIAAAVGTPTISFMGPTQYPRWKPWGEGHIIVRKNIPCIGCNNGFCRIKTHECMQRIEVSEVMQHLEQAWKKVQHHE